MHASGWKDISEDCSDCNPVPGRSLEPTTTRQFCLVPRWMLERSTGSHSHCATPPRPAHPNQQREPAARRPTVRLWPSAHDARPPQRKARHALAGSRRLPALLDSTNPASSGAADSTAAAAEVTDNASAAVQQTNDSTAAAGAALSRAQAAVQEQQAVQAAASHGDYAHATLAETQVWANAVGMRREL